MLDPGTEVASPRGTRVQILESSPQRFVIRRSLPPGTGKTAPHRHMDGIERFEVVEGHATGSVGGTARRLAAGDVLEVPVGSSHVHPHTMASERATVVHTIEPRPRFVEVYFASWLGWLERGQTDAQDEPTLLQIMAVMKNGGGGTWMAGPPVALQKALAEVLGRIAARRGFRAADVPR